MRVDAVGYLQPIAVLQLLHELLAPPSKADDCELNNAGSFACLS
jgi:hypothetical protein